MSSIHTSSDYSKIDQLLLFDIAWHPGLTGDDVLRHIRRRVDSLVSRFFTAAERPVFWRVLNATCSAIVSSSAREIVCPQTTSKSFALACPDQQANDFIQFLTWCGWKPVNSAETQPPLHEIDIDPFSDPRTDSRILVDLTAQSLHLPSAMYSHYFPQEQSEEELPHQHSFSDISSRRWFCRNVKFMSLTLSLLQLTLF
jgi:hypothetical protein